MAALHLIRSSAFNSGDLAECYAIAGENDGILLLDDGCYNLHHPLTGKFINKISNDNFFVIEHHYQARGLSIANSPYQAINMETLVQLSLQFDKTITWQQ